MCRKAHVVEINMGAAPVQNTIQTCTGIEHLEFLGILEHKLEYVQRFCSFDNEGGLSSVEFTRRWTGSNPEDRGLLLHVLVCAGHGKL